MRRHILILVENLSVPFDRRVWQESRALADAGFEVTVICPTGANQDREREAVIEGVRILRYPLRAATGGPLGYLREYTVALWHTLRLAIKVRREGRIDIVHACNPPDLLFLIALALRPGGTRFVFDHHDLVPELFLSRFPGGGRILYRLTRFVERLTFAAADAVISTNESYRRVAIERGKMAADRVVVVRSAPDLSRFIPREPDDQPASRQTLSARVPGRDGAAGRGRLRAAGAAAVASTRSDVTTSTASSWARAMRSTRWSRSVSNSASRTSWISPAGWPTSSSSVVFQPPTCACRRTR